MSLPTVILFELEEYAMTGLSNNAYAKHRGVSESAVRKALRTGRITANEYGLIDPEQADQQWAANTDFSKARAHHRVSNNKSSESKQNTESAYQRAKIANEILKAQIGKIELRILKGELIDRKKTENYVFNLSRQIRDHWLNWPARVSAQFAAELKLDEHFVYTVLHDAIREELTRRSQPPMNEQHDRAT